MSRGAFPRTAPRRPLNGQCACLGTGALYNNILFTYDVPD